MATIKKNIDPADLPVPTPIPAAPVEQAPTPKPKKKKTGSKKIHPKVTRQTGRVTAGYCHGLFAWYPLTSFTKNPKYSNEFLEQKK